MYEISGGQFTECGSSIHIRVEHKKSERGASKKTNELLKANYSKL